MIRQPNGSKSYVTKNNNYDKATKWFKIIHYQNKNIINENNARENKKHVKHVYRTNDKVLLERYDAPK